MPAEDLLDAGVFAARQTLMPPDLAILPIWQSIREIIYLLVYDLLDFAHCSCNGNTAPAWCFAIWLSS